MYYRRKSLLKQLVGCQLAVLQPRWPLKQPRSLDLVRGIGN